MTHDAEDFWARAEVARDGFARETEPRSADDRATTAAPRMPPAAFFSAIASSAACFISAPSRAELPDSGAPIPIPTIAPAGGKPCFTVPGFRHRASNVRFACWIAKRRGLTSVPTAGPLETDR